MYASPPLIADATVPPKGEPRNIAYLYLSCLPLGEGAERSEAEGGCASQLTYRVATKNFPENRLQGFVVSVNVI